MKKGALAIAPDFVLDGGKLVEMDLAQIPAVRAGHIFNFVARLGKRDIEANLPGARPFEQKLHGHRRLPHPGVALNEIQTIPRQPTADDIVQTFDAHGAARIVFEGRRVIPYR